MSPVHSTQLRPQQTAQLPVECFRLLPHPTSSASAPPQIEHACFHASSLPYCTWLHRASQIEHGCLYNVSNHYQPYCDCGQPPGAATATECYAYQGAELSYFLSQLGPTVALTSKVVHSVYPEVTVGEMCDVYCCVANLTWESEGAIR